MLPERSRFLLLAGLCCFLLLAAPPVAAGSFAETLLAKEGWSEQSLAPGVQLRQRQFGDLFGAAQFISVLEVDLDQRGTRIAFAAAPVFDRERLILPELAEQSGAVAAINGGFFRGEPVLPSGIVKIDGKVFPFLEQEPDELKFVAGAALGIDEAGQWHFRLRPGLRWPDDWPEVRHALAGGHPLILQKRLHPVIEREDYDPRREARHAGVRQPRTAIGLTRNRVALLLTVDGRHSGRAEGITLRELALLMEALGCVNAINLDGGGSTTMWVRNRGIVNHPSDNRAFDSEGARRISTAVIVTREPARRVDE